MYNGHQNQELIVLPKGVVTKKHHRNQSDISPYTVVSPIMKNSNSRQSLQNIKSGSGNIEPAF
jgi:hypothetical protein